MQALSSIVSSLLALDSDKLAWWRHRVGSALGANARVIADVIPELHLLLPDLPEVPALPAIEASNRLRVMFESFIRSIATPDQPLAIFLDDLQWADGGSLKLLEILASDTDPHAVMVVLAYREHEVDAHHPAQATLNLLNERGVQFTTIELGPLTQADLKKLVVDAFKLDELAAHNLAGLLASRAAGNPFFVAQVLRALFHEGVIALDSGKMRFVYDHGRAQATPLAANVLDLVLAELRELPPISGKALAYAGVFGAEFSLSALGRVMSVSPSELSDALDPAIRLGMIVPLDPTYRLLKSADGEIPVRFRFSHDRIQQASVQLFSDGELRKAHLGLGRYYAELNEARALLEAARHLYAAKELLTAAELAALPELCCRAGNEAVRTAAYQDAFEYFEMGLNAHSAVPTRRDHSITAKLYVRLVEIGYNAGQLQKLEYYFSTIDAMPTTTDESLAVIPAYISMASALRQMGKYREAIVVSCRGLALLGAPLPEHPSLVRVGVELLTLQLKFNAKTVHRVVNLPELEDKRHLAIADLYAEIAGAAFFVNKNLLALSLIKRTKHLLTHGMSESGANGIAAYTAVMAGTFKKYKEAHEIASALVQNSSERGYGLGYLRTAIIAYGLVNPWREARRSEAFALEQLAQESLANGDLEWGCN